MRESGILLHISCLPSPYGIGTLGKSAYDFVDFLKRSGQKYWQVLPIGQTSYGDSPYQTFSSFAGNPYFIDLDLLKEEGLLEEYELRGIEVSDVRKVDYEYTYSYRYDLLRKAFKRFTINNDFKDFMNNNNHWLKDYCLFMTIKNINGGNDFSKWNDGLKLRDPKAINDIIVNHEEDLYFWSFVQYKFFTQWHNLKKYANDLDIKIIGDMPIYLSLDSVDVWSEPKNFLLDENLVPKVVSGVPPDYFSKTGQLWGNPIYDYDYMKKNNYKWWIRRIEESFKLFDVVRIDHFRGFEAYWQIPNGEKTAINGKWVKGPGIELFNTIKEKLGDLDIIAEDLGLLTPEVHELLEKTKYPGMKVLQFAFNEDEDSLYLPHNHIKNSVCYTGTHDNMTLKEWIDTMDKKNKDFLYQYVGINNDFEASDKIIKCALSSVCYRVIIPLTDYLGYGSEARFNTPSTLGNNWAFRITYDDLSKHLENRIYYNTKLYKRIKKSL